MMQEEEQKTLFKLKSLFHKQEEKFVQKHFVQQPFEKEQIQELLKQVDEGLQMVDQAKHHEEISQKVQVLQNLNKQKLKQFLQILFKKQQRLQDASSSKLVQDFLDNIIFEVRVPQPPQLKIVFPNDSQKSLIDQEMVKSLYANPQLRAMDERDDKMAEFKSFGQDEDLSKESNNDRSLNMNNPKMKGSYQVPIIDHKIIIPKTVNPEEQPLKHHQSMRNVIASDAIVNSLRQNSDVKPLQKLKSVPSSQPPEQVRRLSNLIET